MKKDLLIAATAMAGSLLITPALAADSVHQAAGTEYVWNVDMRGHPPFKRERVPVQTVDVASIETVVTETVTIRDRDYRGRPPFKRRVTEVPVVDTAAIEMEEEKPRTDFRGRPPFRRHR